MLKKAAVCVPYIMLYIYIYMDIVADKISYNIRNH